MVNPKATGPNKEEKNKLDELMMERKKTAVHCLNLECRNEQLKILIDKLHNLADQRAGLITNESKVYRDINYHYLDNGSILDELVSAKENNKKLEKSISELKKRILKIDEMLSR